MGCTSSAPNMANSSTAEKSIQFEDGSSDDQSKDVEEIIYRATNDTNVLPTCDTLPEPVNLVRNKSTPSLKHENENSENQLRISDNMNKAQSSESLQQEEKASRLEAVVDKFVGIHITEHVDNTQPVEKVSEEPPKIEEPTDKSSSKENIDSVGKDTETVGQETKKEEHPDESLSPSQSELSRATRWEALADIAAELPPSLTVDPITGQIYSLTK